MKKNIYDNPNYHPSEEASIVPLWLIGACLVLLAFVAGLAVYSAFHSPLLK